MKTSHIVRISVGGCKIDGDRKVEVQPAVYVLEKAVPLFHVGFQKGDGAAVFVLGALLLLFASVDEVVSRDGGGGGLEAGNLPQRRDEFADVIETSIGIPIQNLEFEASIVIAATQRVYRDLKRAPRRIQGVFDNLRSLDERPRGAFVGAVNVNVGIGFAEPILFIQFVAADLKVDGVVVLRQFLRQNGDRAPFHVGDDHVPFQTTLGRRHDLPQRHRSGAEKIMIG